MNRRRRRKRGPQPGVIAVACILDGRMTQESLFIGMDDVRRLPTDRDVIGSLIWQAEVSPTMQRMLEEMAKTHPELWQEELQLIEPQQLLAMVDRLLPKAGDPRWATLEGIRVLWKLEDVVRMARAELERRGVDLDAAPPAVGGGS